MPEEPEYEASPKITSRRPTKRPFVAGVLVVLTFAAALLFRLTRPSPPPETPPPVPEASEPSAESPSTPNAAALPSLPPLDASDPTIRQHLLSLSLGPEWAALLSADDLARRFAAAVAAIRQGKSPRQQFAPLAIDGRFAARSANGRLVADPSSFARYDRITATVVALDTVAARSIWRLLHPLVEQAWDELAVSGVSLDAAVAQAIDHLLAAQAPADAELLFEEGRYRYADTSLESLSPAQKHLLRMGPRNADGMREALRSLRALVETE